MSELGALKAHVQNITIFMCSYMGIAARFRNERITLLTDVMTEQNTIIRPSHRAHRWRIEEPNGPLSNAVCKDCGMEKQFRNWDPDHDFITNNERRETGQGL